MFKIGIVGCGGISRVHLDILSQMSDVEISAICDDGCVHNYDFSRFIFGETKEAKASLFRFKKESTAFDTGTALVKFKSEDKIMLSWSWGLPKGCSGQNIHDILGPKGTIFFPHSGEAKFIINLADENKEFVEVEKESLDKGFKLQMEHFINCIKEDKNPSVGFEEGIKSLEIALAVLKSADSGKTIYL